MRRRALTFLRYLLWPVFGDPAHLRLFRKMYGGVWGLVYVDICCHCDIWFEDFDPSARRPHFEHLLRVETWSEGRRTAAT